jgi:hypothetical protein
MDNKTENNTTTDEKINEFVKGMTVGAETIVVSYKNMLVGAEEALAVIEDPAVQDAIATIATRCVLAYERIKERTDKNIDELKARRPEFYKPEKEEEDTEEEYSSLSSKTEDSEE